MRLRVEYALPLAALMLLSACGGASYDVQSAPAPVRKDGPAADYPVVVGQPYTIDGVTYTPVDTLNYDAVGFANIGPLGGSAVSAAHRTLPLPSYVEVTALDSGKTILVRIERRGPATGKSLIQLSPGAAQQLGLVGQYKVAVRVRRVNPIEPERALLRAGQQAPARIETPKSLLAVLQRKLEKQEGVPLAMPSDPPPQPAPVREAPQQPALAAAASPQSRQSWPQQPRPRQERPAPVARGDFIVQVGAFSDAANARNAAARTGGSATQAGGIWRVRLGPYMTEAQARAALAKAQAAGYKDARVFHAH